MVVVKIGQDGKPRGKVEGMHLDLTSFKSITEFAKAFKAKNMPLHTLVSSAWQLHSDS